jgi:hypothetical protein
MTKEKKEERERRPIYFLGILFPKLPSLTIRLGGTFLRFKRNANKAGKVFKNELIKQGIDKNTAIGLTEIYMDTSHIRNFIQKM